jgi:hypothetical protein
MGFAPAADRNNTTAQKGVPNHAGRDIVPGRQTVNADRGRRNVADAERAPIG